MIVCVGRDHWARRLRVAKGAPTPVGPLCPLCRRRDGSQTRPSHLHPLVSVGEGLAPPPDGFAPRRLVGGGFRRPGGEPLLERSKRGEKIAGGLFRWTGHIHFDMDVTCPQSLHPRPPIYGRAWFGGLVEMYRRGVVSDTSPFSRPLPLCGKTRGPSVLPV